MLKDDKDDETTAQTTTTAQRHEQQTTTTWIHGQTAVVIRRTANNDINQVNTKIIFIAMLYQFNQLRTIR